MKTAQILALLAENLKKQEARLLREKAACLDTSWLEGKITQMKAEIAELSPA